MQLSSSSKPIQKHSLKRSRCCPSLVLLAAAATSLVHQAHSFVTPSISPSLLAPLHARATLEEVTPIAPKVSGSKKRRDDALKAMKRTKVESALDGVDAQMLELLSDQFLYPEKQKGEELRKPSRPHGRPDHVPGAMRFDTMLKFQEQQQLESLEDSPAESLASTSPSDTDTSSGPKRIRSKIRGKSFPSSDQQELPDASSASNGKKRVVKNLPSPRDPSSEKLIPKRELKGRAKANNLELQKYYSTQLLTAEEEYSLGVQIQLMIKCELVHEGLAVEKMRLPTIEEWARACGYVMDDGSFVYQEGMEQIRPAGAESMFQEVDPNKFVGNGLAQDAGPGRGRGREKKPPPTKLRDVFDNKRQGKEKKQPLNRGSTLDFVDMMMDGRQAKQRMVQSNMRLVISIAKKYSNVGVGLQDLVQEGSIGLSRAAEKFDPSKGFKFSTYASWYV